MAIDIGEFVSAVRSALDVAGLPDQITEPDRIAVARIMHSDPLGQSAVEEFEARLGEVCHRRHVIAVSSGTAALHLALLGLGAEPRYYSVAVPAMGFVAAANAVLYCGARPEFIDACPVHGGIDMYHPAAPMPCSVIGIDLWGHPGGMERLERFCGGVIPLIEDACQALGSSSNGRPCGSFGKISVLSFNVNKIVTTGGGGAVLTDDGDLAEHVRHLRQQAKDSSQQYRYDYTGVGYNYRMPNICAALGVSQLGRLRELVADRRALADAYRGAFEQIGGVSFVDEPDGAVSNCWMPTCRIVGDLGDHGGTAVWWVRDRILDALAVAGMPGRAAFTPLPMLPQFRSGLVPQFRSRLDGRNYPVAVDHYDRTICLPVRRGVK